MLQERPEERGALLLIEGKEEVGEKEREKKSMEEKKKMMMRVAAVLLVILIAYCGFMMGSKLGTKPEIIEVPNTTPNQLKVYFPMESQSTLEDMSHQIQRAKEKQAPTYQYYTTTQKAADEKAQQLAKSQKADKVIKNTTKEPVLDETGKQTSDSVIRNDYYAINLERKHKVKAGSAVIGGEPYVSIGYQNRDVEYKAYYNPKKQIAGVGIEVTIAKW